MNEDTDPDETITPAHEKAFDEAEAILNKYFDHWVLAVAVRDDANKITADKIAYNGGILPALGLAVKSKQYLMEGN